MKVRAIIAVLVALAVIVAGCASADTAKETETVGEIQESSSIAFPEKSSQGAVTVSLTPEYDNAGTLKVKYSLNTHTVDLGAINLRQQVVLEMGNKNISPENAPVLQGHHTSGILEFRVGDLAFPFRIVVSDVPDVEERVIEWDEPEASG